MRKSSRTLLTVAVTTILVLSMIGTGATASASSSSTDEISVDNPEFSESESSSQLEEPNDRSITIQIESLTITVSEELTSILNDYRVIPVLEGLFGDFIEIDAGEEIPIDDNEDEDKSDDETETDDEDETDDESEPDNEDETDEGESNNETESGDEDTTDAEELDLAEVEQYIHQAVNEERAAHGVDELSFDTELRDIARVHSQDMAERDYLAHEDPEGNGFTDRYEQAGYECSVNGYVGGENIAQTWYDTPVSTDERGTVRYENERELGYGVVEQWMNSPGHADNILAPHWEKEGIGVAMTEDNKVYVTQNFC